MAFFTGRYGSLQIGSQAILKIRDWSLDSTVELLNTNTVDSCANTFVPGVKGATGSATVLYYRKEAGDSAITEDFSYLMSQSGALAIGDVDTSNRVLITLVVGSGDICRAPAGALQISNPILWVHHFNRRYRFNR